ncbi:MAG: 1-deoxy-D-xylulose-5-phosphate synthase [Clostridia bacterium]|nr:1-deoxy-D-xylulose-5-phosphate synthase [Clostridia bacterium]
MSKILDEINSSADIKKLNIPELNTLAEEIRKFLVENISKTGGHLSSNLGTVELTLALHKVFDFSYDKIVWDVGHQSYTHKIITGRKNLFNTLRQKDGISGFPKVEESESDAFNTGHSSTSISAALGFAEAFELCGSSSRAVAVIGDGALTGGMAYEALNQAGSSKSPLIVILNDNGMSISENVGGISQSMRKVTSHAKYIDAKTSLKKFLQNLPLFGQPFVDIIIRGKRLLKNVLFQKKLFENMGLEYLGPVDGHDLKELITIINYGKSLCKPVIIHVLTQKGRGYAPSENDPSFFHGVGRFDPETGEPVSSGTETYSDVFGDEIVKLAKENPRLVGITAAMPLGTGLIKFANIFPDRFFDVGIAEQHAVTFSAAMALSGYIPVFAVYSTFLQRGYDQIIHDAALQNLHVVFAIDRAGASGNDGETHQGIYDLSYLSHIPNMTVMAPSSNEELRLMLRHAVNDCSGPVAIRYPKGSNPANADACHPVSYGKGIVEKEGTDVLLVALGSQVQEAMKSAEILEHHGISIAVMNARFLKPFDEELFLKLKDGKKLIATLEDNVCIGGLSSIVRRIVNENILDFGFPDKPLSQGTVSQQKAWAEIDAQHIAEKIINTLEGDNRG